MRVLFEAWLVKGIWIGLLCTGQAGAPNRLTRLVCEEGGACAEVFLQPQICVYLT